MAATINLEALYQKAANLIREADGLLITAGAGMGVDSGLPDFRGNRGFWRVYPALRSAGMSFQDIAQPENFQVRPSVAWGFYGHRLKLYRETVPHEGFNLLQSMTKGLRHGVFVLTSNVDGHFQKAGFSSERIYEVHGSIHHLQCANACCSTIWFAGEFLPEIDSTCCRLISDPPLCPYCKGIARPNILMFGDWHFSEERCETQEDRYKQWRNSVQSPVVLELGAGTTIATVRYKGEKVPGPMIRINTRDFRVQSNKMNIGIPVGALEGLRGIAKALEIQG